MRAELGHLLCYLQRSNRRCRWALPPLRRERAAVPPGHRAGDTSSSPQRLWLRAVRTEPWAAATRRVPSRSCSAVRCPLGGTRAPAVATDARSGRECSPAPVASPAIASPKAGARGRPSSAPRPGQALPGARAEPHCSLANRPALIAAPRSEQAAPA